MTAALLFCADPLFPRPAGRVDPHFASTAQVARGLGATVGLIDHDALTAGDPEQAVRRVPIGIGPAWYCGWMVTPAEYTALAQALATRGCTLLTNPDAYRTAHEFPGWYDTFTQVTPNSVHTPYPNGEPLDAWLDTAVTTLCAGGAIVKDYTKSRKHEPDAFHIPDITNRTRLHQVVSTFIERQDTFLAAGLVLRRFEDFTPADHPGGEEARVWWLDGEPVAITAHPDTPGQLPEPDLTGIHEPVAQLPARFITTDLAQRTDGTWRVIEVGDSQVSDWPQGTDTRRLVDALSRARGRLDS